MIKLEISPFEGQPARVFPLTQPSITVGRNPDSDLVLNSGIISGEHAEIKMAEGEPLMVVDLGSSNGTFINGEPVTSGILKSGDRVRFGNVEALLTETQYPRKSQQAEASVFESSAISRAKRAMENQKMGLASGRSEAVKVESAAVRAAASGEVDLSETDQPPVPKAPDTVLAESKPTAASSKKGKPSPTAQELRKANELAHALEQELKQQVTLVEELTRVRDQQATDSVGSKGQIQKLQSELGAANEKVAGLEALRHDLDEAREKAQNEQALQDQLSDEKQTREALEQRVNQQAEELLGLQERLESQQGDSQSTDANLVELREQLQQAAVEGEAVDNQLAEKSEQAQTLGGEVTVLQGRLDDLTKALRDSEDKSDIEAELGKHVANEEGLKAKIVELEGNDAKLTREKQQLSEQLDEAKAAAEAQATENVASHNREAELQEQVEKVAELESNEAKYAQDKLRLSEQLEEANATIEAQATEQEALRSRDEEQKTRLEKNAAILVEKTAELTRLSESYQKTATDLAVVTASEAALHRAISSKENELTDLQAQLVATASQVDEGAAEKIENASREILVLRSELENLKAVHGDVDEAQKKLETARDENARLEQEIESAQPERERMQNELAAFRQEIETAKATATAERAEVLATLEASRQELAGLTESVNEARQQEDAGKQQFAENLAKMERLQKLAKENLSELETEKANSVNEVKEATLSVRAMELKCKNLDTQMAKQAKASTKLERKLVRRKKLIERLKQVARRERELKKKIEIGMKYIVVADAHAAGKKTPDLVRPWDVDRAQAEREKAIEEARLIHREVDAIKAALKARQDELAQADARLRENGLAPEREDELKRSSEDASRMLSQLRDEREGLTGKTAKSADDVALPN